MNLYAHQQAEIDRNPSKWFFAHGTGTGKTITAIALVNKNAKARRDRAFWLAGDGDLPGLPIEKLNQIADTISPWFTVLCVVPNMGGMLLHKWKKAVKEFGDEGIAYTFITKEQFRIKAKDITYHDALIWDEAHALGNHKSQMFRQCRAWIKYNKPKYIWLLSATPYLATASMSVYAYGNLLGQDWKWVDFHNRFFVPRHFGSRIVFVEKEGIETELAALFHTIGSTVQLRDCIDLPEHVIETELFEQTKEQKQLVKEVMQKESVPITRFGAFHQIASGILKGNEYVPLKYAQAHKNDRVLELAHKHPKLAIFSRYIDHLDLLAGKLADAGIPYGLITGESKNRQETLEMLERSPRAVALISASCSAGYELPSFTAIAFASCSYNYIDYVQSLGRFDRANNEAVSRVIYHLITKDTIDEDIMASLGRKESFDIARYTEAKS